MVVLILQRRKLELRAVKLFCNKEVTEPDFRFTSDFRAHAFVIMQVSFLTANSFILKARVDTEFPERQGVSKKKKKSKKNRVEMSITQRLKFGKGAISYILITKFSLDISLLLPGLDLTLLRLWQMSGHSLGLLWV